MKLLCDSPPRRIRSHRRTSSCTSPPWPRPAAPWPRTPTRNAWLLLRLSLYSRNRHLDHRKTRASTPDVTEKKEVAGIEGGVDVGGSDDDNDDDVVAAAKQEEEKEEEKKVVVVDVESPRMNTHAKLKRRKRDTRRGAEARSSMAEQVVTARSEETTTPPPPQLHYRRRARSDWSDSDERRRSARPRTDWSARREWG